MATDRDDAQNVRQGEYGRRTFVVLIISVTAAALLAIGAYLYVFAEDNTELDGPMPTVGTTEAPTETGTQ